MKKLLTMRNILIAIAFTVFLLVVKDNLNTFWNIIKNIGNILTPFFIGFLIAYILNFPYKFLYNKAFKRMGAKHKFFLKFRKPLALIITYAGTFAADHQQSGRSGQRFPEILFFCGKNRHRLG